MANMSYCMFENTYQDFKECYQKLMEINSLDELSESEKKYAKRLIKEAGEFFNDFDGMLND